MSEYQPYVPEGFDEFWRSTTAEAESHDLDYLIGEIAEVHPTKDGQVDPGTITTEHQIRTFTFRGMAGEILNGWIAEPFGPGPHPAFLWIAPYGRESVMPNQYGTRSGYVSLSFNFHGMPAFHQEKYTPARGYFSEGAGDKESFVFRRMFQNALLASRVLANLESVDAGKIGSMGMSQGGGISVWLGAWTGRIRAVCADMPFLGAMHETLLKGVYRYPLKEVLDLIAASSDGEEKVMRTISYFDTLNQATRCTKPTLVSVGLKDPAVKPPQARAIYAALPGKKELHEYNWGHDWHPDMVETNRAWLDTNL